MSSQLVVSPLFLCGKVQNYDWGKRGRDSLIARLLGSDSDENFAELWIGNHVNGVSRVVSSPVLSEYGVDSDDSQVVVSGLNGSLSDVIMSHPSSILGDAVLERYGNLPFLVKILSVGRALSIQVHPSKEQALYLHKKSPIYYPDSNGKSELAVAITRANLLCGFRTREKIMMDFARVPEILGYLDDVVQQLAVIQLRSDEEFLFYLFSNLLRAEQSVIKVASDALLAALLNLNERTAVDDRVIDLASSYPDGDVGLFCFYLLNYDSLLPGEGVFIKAGTPHAYLDGDFLECLSNSDNVVRVGLTPKYRDVESFLYVANFSCIGSKLTKACRFKAVGKTDSLWRLYPVSESVEFVLDVLQGANILSACNTGGLVSLLFSLDGYGVLHASGSEYSFVPGTAVLMPAGLGDYEISLNGGTIFRVRSFVD